MQKGCGGVGVRGRYSGPPPVGASPTGRRGGAGKEEGQARGAAIRDTKQTGRRPHKGSQAGKRATRSGWTEPEPTPRPGRCRRDRSVRNSPGGEPPAAGREGRARSRGTRTCGEGRVRGPWKEWGKGGRRARSRAGLHARCRLRTHRPPARGGRGPAAWPGVGRRGLAHLPRPQGLWPMRGTCGRPKCTWLPPGGGGILPRVW